MFIVDSGWALDGCCYFLVGSVWIRHADIKKTKKAKLKKITDTRVSTQNPWDYKVVQLPPKLHQDLPEFEHQRVDCIVVKKKGECPYGTP